MRALIGAVAVATFAATSVAASAPAEAAHRPAWRVTVSANRTTLTLGQKVVLTGHVNKSAAGKLVVLQERHKSTAPWKDQANALVHRDGGYQISDRPTVNNRRWYRVLMPATKHHRKGVSRSVVVDVFKWTSLMTFPAVNKVNFLPESSVSMDGTSYPSSLEAYVAHYPDAPTIESVEFNVDHKCTMFRGTFGLSDDSVSGSRATVTALADSAAWFDHTFGLGETSPNAFTFETAPLKVRFESSSVIADLDGRGAVGTPEVYCEQ